MRLLLLSLLCPALCHAAYSETYVTVSCTFCVDKQQYNLRAYVNGTRVDGVLYAIEGRSADRLGLQVNWMVDYDGDTVVLKLLSDRSLLDSMLYRYSYEALFNYTEDTQTYTHVETLNTGYVENELNLPTAIHPVNESIRREFEEYATSVYNATSDKFKFPLRNKETYQRLVPLSDANYSSPECPSSRKRASPPPQQQCLLHLRVYVQYCPLLFLSGT